MNRKLDHAFGSSGKNDQFVCSNWPCPLRKKLTALFTDNFGIAKGSSGDSQNKVFILFVEAVNTGLGYGLTLLLSK